MDLDQKSENWSKNPENVLRAFWHKPCIKLLALLQHKERRIYRALRADYATYNIGFGEGNQGQEQE